MQPMLALTAAHPGIVYLNGRFAGEIGGGEALLRPVAPRGVLLLEFHPLTDACRPMARRIVFSGGEPLPSSAEAAEGVSIVLWPGGAVEMELTPGEWDVPRQSFSRGAASFLLEGGPEPALYCGDRLLSRLPAGAQTPRLHSLREGELLLGACRDGMYLLASDRDWGRTAGFLQARRIELTPEGRILCLVAPGDKVGHAVREEWTLERDGLRLIASEAAWERDAPDWPQTPGDTAIAAVEAALAGFTEEAEGYLAPGMRAQGTLEGLREQWDLCVEMKYAPPGAEAAVGLLKLEGANLARVQPLYYHVRPSEGRPWPYLLNEMQMQKATY